MIVPFRPLPIAGGGDFMRPIVDVDIEGSGLAISCVLDTGAVRTVFDTWIADAAGIGLAGAPEVELGLGGSITTGSEATVTLQLDEFVWDARVVFVSRRLGFGLLGLDGFFSHFDLTLSARDNEFELRWRGSG